MVPMHGCRSWHVHAALFCMHLGHAAFQFKLSCDASKLYFIVKNIKTGLEDGMIDLNRFLFQWFQFILMNELWFCGFKSFIKRWLSILVSISLLSLVKVQ